MPTPITISVNFIDLTGSAISGYMVATVVPPTGVEDLYVSGVGIISPKSLTSTSGTSVSLAVWGNDVIVDAADGADDTYYTINLFKTSDNSLVWSAAYLFTGAGPINLVGYPILNPIPPAIPPSFPVVQPPGGSNTDVQFNNAGVFGGSSKFTFNSTTGALLLDSLTPTLTPIATFTVSATGGGFVPLLELMGAGTGGGNGPFMYFTPITGAGNTGTSRGTLLFVGIDQTGGADSTVTQNGRNAGGWTLQGSGGAVPGALEVGVWGIINPNTALTELFFTPDGGIDFYLANLTPTIHIDAIANTTWLNPTAATALLNQSSPVLKLQGNAWTGSASTADNWTIKDILGSGSNPSSTLTFLHTGPGAPSISLGGTLSTGNVVCNQIDATGIINLDSAAATNITNINSFPTNWNGHYWNGSASTVDTWSFTDVLGTGTNPTSTFTLAHSGTPGTASVSLAGLLVPAPSGATTPTLTQTIASGTAVLGTSLIGSGAKASTVTVSATGVLSTDTLMADFNSDPTSTTGYTPSANGMLTIIKFPTAGNVNFIVVNNTGGSITPGAVTLNWRVVR